MALTQAQALLLLPMVEQGDTRAIGKLLRAFAEGDFNAIANVTAEADEINILDGAEVTTEELNLLSGLTADADEINAVADVSARVQELTASGAVTAGIQSLELNHATVAIAATIADLAAHPGFLMIKNTSASGTESHTVTLSAGTWNGTNLILTLDAPNEAILIYVDSAGNGTIIENVGSVGVSGT